MGNMRENLRRTCISGNWGGQTEIWDIAALLALVLMHTFGSTYAQGMFPDISVRQAELNSFSVKAEIDYFMFFITALLFVSWSYVDSFETERPQYNEAQHLLDKMSHPFKSLFFFVLILQAFLAVVLAQTSQLVFQEDFNTLDRNRWQHLITAWRGGNNEFQYYTNRTENSYVKNGVLFIKPTFTADRFGNDFLYTGILDLNKEGCNINWDNGCFVQAGAEIINPIQSARIVTSKTFSFTYGTVEVRAKMPRGDWIWPAIWMLPTDSVYGNWPRSGEIDIVEARGNADLTCNDGQGKIGNSKMYSTLHWGPDGANNQFQKTSWAKLLSNGTYSSDFHIYRLEWLSTGITFKVDGQVVGSVSPPAGGFWQLSGLTAGTNPWAAGTKMAPFDKKFHFVLNVAVGGNFFPDGCVNVPYNKSWTASSSTPMRSFWERKCEWYPTWYRTSRDDSAMQVDYIRVWSA